MLVTLITNSGVISNSGVIYTQPTSRYTDMISESTEF